MENKFELSDIEDTNTSTTSFTPEQKFRENKEIKSDEELELMIHTAHGRIQLLKDKYQDILSGGSSFMDVTGNLYAPCPSNFRFWKEDREIQDYEIIVTNLQALNEYLDILNSENLVLQQEMTNRDGALPDWRQAADKQTAEGKTKQPILYYVEQLKLRYHPKKEHTVQ